MYGRPEDKNWGPDPAASQEVIKREKEAEQEKKPHLFNGKGDAKGTADTNELDVKTKLQKHDLPYNK